MSKSIKFVVNICIIKNKMSLVIGYGREIWRHIAIKIAASGGKAIVNVRKNIEEGNETLTEVNKISEGILSVADIFTEESGNKISAISGIILENQTFLLTMQV